MTLLIKCAKCGQLKSCIDFYKNKKNENGFDCWCKVCRIEYQKSIKNKTVKKIRTFKNTFKEIFGLE